MIVLAAVVALVAGLILGCVAAAHSRGIDGLVKQTVVIHTKDDRSVRGVLTGAYRDCLVLSHPSWLNEAQETDLEGEAVVPRDNVGWMQVVA